MSLSKRVEDELYRDVPAREPEYGEELDRPEYPWPTEQELADDQRLALSEPE